MENNESFNPYVINLQNGLPNPRKFSKELIALRNAEKYTTIETRGRLLSQIAYEVYGNNQYWIILTNFNNIINPMSVPESIDIPDPQAVADLVVSVQNVT